MPGKPGILDTLSEEQQEQLLTWLEIYPVKDVLEKVAAPPPDGFGIKTHITSLRRFQHRAQFEARAQDLLTAQQGNLADADRGTMLSAASDALIHNAFRLAANPRPNGHLLAAVTRSLVALQRQKSRERELDIAERRLELERKKLEVLVALREAQSPTQYQEQKISELREDLLLK